MPMPKNEIPKIAVLEPAASMPEWAVLERSLINLMNEAVDFLLDHYLTPDGEHFWPDVEDFQTYAYSNVDNVFEGFFSWPLFYLMGGSDRFLHLAHKQHEAVIKQFSKLKKKDLGIDEQFAAETGRDTLLVDEYLPDIDWMHQGEAAQLFYYLNLADPKHDKNRERAIKFAGFFTNEAENLPALNYDPVHRVFRSSLIGSNGPAFCKFERPYFYSSWMEPYGLAYYDVPGVQTMLDLKDPDKAARYGKVYRDRLQKADTVTNLMATSMVLNAYLHTGEDTYRRWVLDYIEGWRERYAASPNGLMPDNAGPTGKVGETMDGKWYGGHYGWTFPHGFKFIGDSLVIAGENERLLTGKRGLLQWVREQTEMLRKHAIEDDQGRVLLPQKYADPESVIEYKRTQIVKRSDRVTDEPGFERARQIDGWYEFAPAFPSHMSHVYMDTFSDEDKQLIFELRDKSKNSWDEVSPAAVNRKTMGGQYNAYINYLNGGFPDYPVAALKHSLNQIYSQLKTLREELQGAEVGMGYPPDDEEQYEELREITRQINEKYGRQFSESVVHSYFQTFLLYRNTVTIEALVHLTLGGLPAVYNGGLLQVSVRYFDAIAKRPGLPEDVAALVSSVQNEAITLTLCNVHPLESRTVIVQAGAFGEHHFEQVTYRLAEQNYNEDEDSSQNGTPDRTLEVDGRWFEVELSPGSLIKLDVSMRRYAHNPSYIEPFDE